MIDVPFAYSSNGDGFAEHDFLTTGRERQFSMMEFPSEQELIACYKKESGMTKRQEAVIRQPYYISQDTYPPRYYQRIAVKNEYQQLHHIVIGQQSRLTQKLLLHLGMSTKPVDSLASCQVFPLMLKFFLGYGFWAV